MPDDHRESVRRQERRFRLATKGALDMKEEILRSLFTIAGLPVLETWRLENNYWPTPDFSQENLSGPNKEYHIESALRYAKLRQDSPWWLVKTPIGLMQIGWRKRVISIDWSECDVRVIVTQDDTTKSETMVHAWSELDAAKYLGALRQAAEARVGVALHV